jgi:hypothetical protein
MAGYNTSLDAAPIVRDSVTHDRGRSVSGADRETAGAAERDC